MTTGHREERDASEMKSMEAKTSMANKPFLLTCIMLNTQRHRRSESHNTGGVEIVKTDDTLNTEKHGKSGTEIPRRREKRREGERVSMCVSVWTE